MENQQTKKQIMNEFVGMDIYSDATENSLQGIKDEFDFTDYDGVSAVFLEKLNTDADKIEREYSIDDLKIVVDAFKRFENPHDFFEILESLSDLRTSAIIIKNEINSFEDLADEDVKRLKFEGEKWSIE